MTKSFTFFKPNFSESLTYIMSHEVSLLMRILDTSKLTIAVVITNGKISLGMLSTFWFSLNPRIATPTSHLMMSIPYFIPLSITRSSSSCYLSTHESSNDIRNLLIPSCDIIYEQSFSPSNLLLFFFTVVFALTRAFNDLNRFSRRCPILEEREFPCW